MKAQRGQQGHRHHTVGDIQRKKDVKIRLCQGMSVPWPTTRPKFISLSSCTGFAGESLGIQDTQKSIFSSSLF